MKNAPGGEGSTTFRVTGDDGQEIPDTDLPMQISAREGKEIRDIEFNITFENGRSVRLVEYAAPLFDEAGKSRGCVAAFVDVSERRRVEARDRFLVRLDDETRQLTDPALIALTAVRLLGQHLRADRAAYVEVEADEDTATIFADFSPPYPSVVGRYRFSDYGHELVEAVRSNRPFAEDDVEVGLAYFGKRYSSALLGRWTSADPLAVHDLGSDVNGYAIVHGRLFREVDPQVWTRTIIDGASST